MVSFVAWLWVVRPVFRSEVRTPILTYHDFIVRRGPGSLWFDCTVSELDAQLRWMTAHGAHFVSIDQIYAHLVSGRPLPSHAVAITAADGYLGFYKLAVPVFERYHVPVTEFVHTKFVGGRQGRWKMNWSQLKQLDREGLVSIQSQTVTHEDLPTLSVDKVDWEMRESKHVLEARLGHPIRFIAYPDGKFDARSERAAQQAGYAMAFSEVTRPCEESPSFFAVNRYVHTKWRQAWRDSFGD